MRPMMAVALIMSLAATGAGASEAALNQGAVSLASLTPTIPDWSRPLPMSGEDTRLIGEAVSREIPIFLTSAEAGRTAKFQLSYQNSISVMPETFRLTVKINDVLVGDTVVQNASKAEMLSLNVPIGVLQAGFNSVRVSVRQSHRVDCSIKSTYELWTQLVPEQSGLIFSGTSAEIKSLQDLAAVNPGRDGTVSIRVRDPGDREASKLNQAARALQAAVMLGHYAHPRVELVSNLTSEPGLDVLVGTASELVESAGVKVPGIGPRHHLHHNVQTGNVILIVTGENGAEVDAALDALAEEARSAVPQGSTAGIRALKNASGREVTGGETITFADLGHESEPFRGRLHRQTLKIRMPADLLAADYDRVVIAADAVYAAGLLPTSKMIVRVNGTAIADSPMSNRAGEILAKKSFHLPVSTFKPGLNTVDFEAETRNSGDEKCSLEALVDQRERFLLSNTSTVTIPALGRVGALPNISSVLPGGLARVSGSDDLTVYVPSARPEAVSAALTTLAKMASISRQETKTRFAFDLVPAGSSHVLAFGAYGDMPDSILRASGLDPDQLRRAWRQPGSRTPVMTEAMPRVQVASAGGAIALSSPVASDRGASDRAIAESTGSLASPGAAQTSKMLKLFEGGEASWLHGYAQSALGVASRLVEDVVAQANALRSGHREDLVLNDASTLVVAQGARTDDFRDWGAKLLPDVTSTTVFIARDPEHLSQAVSEVLSGALWQQFVGDAAVYSSRDGSIHTRVSQQILLVPTEGLGLQNVRLIAAGWLSRNVPIYLAALLSLLVILTAFMQWVLRSSGVREP